jgi:hypothetical protein
MLTVIGDNEEDKFEYDNATLMSLKQMGGTVYMPNMMQKTVRVLIENDI